MDRLLNGYAYDLKSLIRVEGYQGFLLESDYNKSTRERKYDLGMNRILKYITTDTFLILIGDDEIVKIELQEECKISDTLRNLGYKCEVIAEYGGRIGKDGKRHGTEKETWKSAVSRREAIFSKNGYVLQYKGWLDGLFVQFKLNIIRKDQIIIEGHDIEGFRLWNVDVDVLEKAKDLIEKVLLEKHCITEQNLLSLLKEHNLGNEIIFLEMIERRTNINWNVFNWLR
ncbi:hypothetical protein ACQRBK_01035 [Peptoniphilaceae bacterium SGI.137]